MDNQVQQPQQQQQNFPGGLEVEQPLDNIVRQNRQNRNRQRRGGLRRETGGQFVRRRARNSRQQQLARARGTNRGQRRQNARSFGNTRGSSRRIAASVVPVPVVSSQPPVVVLPVAAQTKTRKNKTKIVLTRSQKQSIAQQLTNIAQKSAAMRLNTTVAAPRPQPIRTNQSRRAARANARRNAARQAKSSVPMLMTPIAPMQPMMMMPGAPMYPVSPMGAPLMQPQRSVPRSQRRLGARR